MFDAIWTAALALNKTQSQLNSKNISLKDFTYKDEYGISNIIYKEALKLKFFGLSVSIIYSYQLCMVDHDVCIGIHCRYLAVYSSVSYTKYLILLICVGRCFLSGQWRQTRKNSIAPI